MDIDEATAILKNRTGDWHTQTAAAAYTISFYNEHRDRLKPVPGSRFTTDADGPRPPRSTTTDGAKAMDPMGYLRSVPGETPQQYCARVSREHQAEQARKRTRDAARGPDWAAALDKAQNSGRTRDAETNPSGMGGYEFPTAEQSEMGNRPGGVHPVGAELVMELPDDRFGYFISKSDSGKVALFRHRLADGVQNLGVTTADYVRFGKQSEKRQQNAMKSVASTVRRFWEKQSAA